MVVNKQSETMFHIILNKEELSTIANEIMHSNLNDGPVIDRNVNSLAMADVMVAALKIE